MTPDFAGKPNARQNITNAAGQEITPDRLSALLDANNKSAQSLGKGQQVNLEQLGEGRSPNDVAKRIQEMDRVSYESDTAESYHAIKHQNELPSQFHDSDPVQNFNSAAQQTIQHGTVVDAALADGGSTRVIIHRIYPATTPSGAPQIMEAIIYVDANGTVTLASFGRAKAIK